MSSRPRIRRTPTSLTANRLWIHRKKMGYTQREVARLLGFRTATHLSDHERGRRLPTLRTAIKLEVVLCAPVAFLFPNLRHRALEEVRTEREKINALSYVQT